MKVNTNDSGETIVTVKDEIPDITMLPKDIPLIINSNIELCLEDFKLMIKTDDNFMYANVLAQKEFPGFKFERIRKVRAVIIVRIGNKQKRQLLGVKPGKDCQIRNVSGTVRINESYRECLMRVVQEETNIQPSEITSMTYFNSKKYTTVFHGQRIPARSTLFEVNVHLTADRFSQIKKFTSSRIVSVYSTGATTDFSMLTKTWALADILILKSRGLLRQY